MIMSPAPYMAPIAMWCTTMGLTLVRNSCRDTALTDLAKQLSPTSPSQQRPSSVIFAIDGPNGPAHIPKRGCIQLAQTSGAPIVHVSYSSARGVRDLSRWDRWLWPVLGDEIVVRYSRPLLIAPDTSLEEATRQVQALAASVDFESGVK
jgi:lysophospholipid acyltransferase (LPLAT)-like uncharacterized protein